MPGLANLFSPPHAPQMPRFPNMPGPAGPSPGEMAARGAMTPAMMALGPQREFNLGLLGAPAGNLGPGVGSALSFPMPSAGSNPLEQFSQSLTGG